MNCHVTITLVRDEEDDVDEDLVEDPEAEATTWNWKRILHQKRQSLGKTTFK